MNRTKVFVGLGGNIGDPLAILKQSLGCMEKLPQVFELRVSNFYKTSPVSSLPQEDYINAVCTFETTLSSMELLKSLQQIERELGKKPKAKDQPRLIDLDLLFFGREECDVEQLQLPHPRWHERLFVLIPLRDLTAVVWVGDKSVLLDEVIKKNSHFERVTRYA